jgi:GAF domain-containing protein
MRDFEAFYRRVIERISAVGAAASSATGPEEAVGMITREATELLGDREAWKQTGNLKSGEKNQYACGCFFLLPGGEKQVLLAPQNYGPDQNHMIIATNIGHPGWVIANRKPLLLANTDDHGSFVKILQTFRAGSAMYSPIVWNNEFLGQMICASQARNTFSEFDLAVHVALAQTAAALWMAKGGVDFVNQFAVAA